MSRVMSYKRLSVRFGGWAIFLAVGLVSSRPISAKAQMNKMTSPTTSDLYAVWGSAWNHVYAVGEDTTILEFDGTTWTGMYHVWQGGDFRGVWGTAWDNVYVVGDAGKILVYKGANWMQMVKAGTNQPPTTENLNGIWGSGPKDIFAVGDNGTILHHDGTAWSKMNSGTTWDWDDVYGTGPNDVYAVGYDGMVHYDGSKWSTVPTPSGTAYALSAVWGSAPDNYYSVGSNAAVIVYDGTDWSWMFAGQGNLGSGWTSTVLPSFLGIWGSGPGDVWTVGTYTAVLQLDGSILRVRSFDNIETTPGPALHDVWGAGWGGNVYAVGEGGLILVYRRNRVMVTVEILSTILNLIDPSLIGEATGDNRFRLRENPGWVGVTYDQTGHAMLSATPPNAGIAFSHWEGQVTEGHEQDNPLTLQLPAGGGMNVTAVFAPAVSPPCLAAPVMVVVFLLATGAYARESSARKGFDAAFKRVWRDPK